MLLACSLFGGVSVFEMPDLHVRHMRLLALMDKSHQEGDYITMEVASREGIKAGTADELWYYNLACALTCRASARKPSAHSTTPSHSASSTSNTSRKILTSPPCVTPRR